MNATELIEMAKRGERIPRQPHSLHAEQQPGDCSHRAEWRCIVCNEIEDIMECPICGAHRVTTCNFDEEMS